jgi:phage shock protein B
MNVGVLSVVMVFLIPLVLIVCGSIVLVLGMLTRGRRSRNGAGSEEETRMIQEIYSGLGKLEERIEALETLILDSERKDESS